MTEAFEKLASLLDYPMFVVTTLVDDESGGSGGHRPHLWMTFVTCQYVAV